MKNSEMASLATWLTEPLGAEVARSVERLRAAPDVNHVALMPDVHLAKGVSIGTVVATERLIYPAAVGSDIGCGMAALALDVQASAIADERSAAQVLALLHECIPINKHRGKQQLPPSLATADLTDERLQRVAARDCRVQLGTLGRGNHFFEFQVDQEGQLWMLVHSGSRGVGQQIATWHLGLTVGGADGLAGIDAHSERGRAYLSDVGWARRYAAASRLAMLRAVAQAMYERFGANADWNSLIHSDHNHVAFEEHDGKSWWVHRKGAESARAGEPGIVPGSMGAATFHATGRGCRAALASCSHGAGRKLSRTDARRQISSKQFARQVGRLWYDHRRTATLRDEAPAAYKDIRQVMKAQRELLRIVRQLQPVLTYKG